MGKRGEGWFALQMVLFAVILLAPRRPAVVFPRWVGVIGAVCVVAAAVLGTWSMLALGRNLTPFPRPLAGGSLVTRGPYALVRHPIYSALILGTFGWSLVRGSLPGVLLAALLLVFFDLKARREERWLAEAYGEYDAYRRRVRKLIPWIY